MMKNEVSFIKSLGAKKYNPQKSILNLELSSNYGARHIIESKDATICMYDYAKEILELEESKEEELDG